jgi:hypothetical protein
LGRYLWIAAGCAVLLTGLVTAAVHCTDAKAAPKVAAKKHAVKMAKAAPHRRHRRHDGTPLPLPAGSEASLKVAEGSDGNTDQDRANFASLAAQEMLENSRERAQAAKDAADRDAKQLAEDARERREEEARQREAEKQAAANEEPDAPHETAADRATQARRIRISQQQAAWMAGTEQRAASNQSMIAASPATRSHLGVRLRTDPFTGQYNGDWRSHQFTYNW